MTPLAGGIAWLVYGDLDQRTGGTLYDARIVHGLRALGHRVDVLSIPRGTDPAALVRRIARDRPRYLVADELCFSEIAFVFPRVPFTERVLLVHHLTVWEEELPRSARQLARRGEAVALRHADRVIATSARTRARLLAEGCRAPVDVVLPGADRLARQPRAACAPGRSPVFLFVGAILPRKRVRELVRVFADPFVPACLRLAGSRTADPVYAATVARDAERAPPGAVTLLGELDDAGIARELAAADVFVMPSSLEGYGIAATEALHAGLPVIAAVEAGLVEALAPAREAVELVGIADLGEAIRRLASDQGRREQLAYAAGQARLPTWDDAVRGFASALGRYQV